MRKLVSSSVFLLLFTCAWAQDSEKASWNCWKNSSLNDSIRLECLVEFVLTTCSNESDSCYDNCKLLLKESESAGDIRKIVFAHMQMAMLDWNSGEYLNAANTFKTASHIAKLSGLHQEYARNLNNTAYAFREAAMLDSAYFYHNQAYEVCKKWEVLTFLSASIYGCGHTSKLRGDYMTALAFYKAALDIALSQNDSSNIFNTYIGLGSICRLQKNFSVGLKNYKNAEAHLPLNNVRTPEFRHKLFSSFGNLYGDMGDTALALEYQYQALDFAKTRNDKRNECKTLANIASYVRDNTRKRQLLDSAFYIAKELGNQRLLSNVLTEIANCEVELQNFDEAVTIGYEALDLSELIGNAIELRDANLALAFAYEGLGNADSAFVFLKEYYALKDSIENVDTKQRLIEISFENEYQEKAVRDSMEYVNKQAIISERTEKQRLGLIAACIGIVLLLLLAYSVYRGKRKSDELLLNILPEETARELKKTGSSEAKLIDDVTVIFTDFKGFTSVSEQLSPEELVKDLNECFSAFDLIMEKHGIEKIKTIGDAYMAACGLPIPNLRNAEIVIKAAFEIRDFVEQGKQKKIEQGQPYFDIRIGIHTGPVVAGIVGIKKFQYDIWGDTVNTASRMESSGAVSKVNISDTTYQLVKDKFNCEYRGEIEAKGKGKVKMYFVEEYTT